MIKLPGAPEKSSTPRTTYLVTNKSIQLDVKQQRPSSNSLSRSLQMIELQRQGSKRLNLPGLPEKFNPDRIKPASARPEHLWHDPRPLKHLSASSKKSPLYSDAHLPFRMKLRRNIYSDGFIQSSKRQDHQESARRLQQRPSWVSNHHVIPNSKRSEQAYGLDNDPTLKVSGHTYPMIRRSLFRK